MQEILLHPGFHRTGTSSMQHFAWRNHETLAPYVQLVMLRHLKPVVRQAAHFATTKDPLDLFEMAELLDTAFDARALNDDTNILVSCESLCGHMPGRKAVPDYSAAPLLIQYFAAYLTDRFPEARVRVLLTTRDAQSWLASVYRYQLRMTRLTQAEDAFHKEYAAAADFDSIVAQIKDMVAPLDVLTVPLKEAQAYLQGIGTALLQQCDVPARVLNDLVPVGRGNTGPSAALTEQFLSLNRGALDGDEVADLKTALAKAADLGSWKRA